MKLCPVVMIRSQVRNPGQQKIKKKSQISLFIVQIQTLGKKTEGREEHVQRHDGEAEQREQDAEGGGGEDEADDREVEGSVQESEE